MPGRRTVGGHPLAEARRKKGMSQNDLAEAGGVNRTTIYRIEKGEPPGVLLAIVLARAVGKSVEDLWGAEATAADDSTASSPP